MDPDKQDLEETDGQQIDTNTRAHTVELGGTENVQNLK